MCRRIADIPISFTISRPPAAVNAAPTAGVYLALLPIYCSMPAPSATADAVYPPSPGETGPPGHTPDPLVQLDRELAEIDVLLATAHFHTVLALASKSRGQLDTFGPGAGLAARRVRLEVMAATAEIALGRREQARRSLQRALGVDARLVLDEQATSPKILSLLRELRGGNGLGVQRP